MIRKTDFYKLATLTFVTLTFAFYFEARAQNNANPSAQSPPAMSQASPTSGTTDFKTIQSWFNKYDQIRRKAQLSPKDKVKASALLSKGLAIIVPGDDKVASQKLLRDLVTRYSTAEAQIKLLPLYPETEKLHRGYYQYFNNAKLLFSDYMAVQNNVLATDSFGNPLAKTLLVRKQNLEMLDKNNKSYDEVLRKKFGIAAYKYDQSK